MKTALSPSDNVKIAMERAGRLVANLEHGTCLWREAWELLDELEQVLDQLEDSGQ